MDYTSKIEGLDKIFDDKYVVPIYQRNYSWEYDQIKDFIEDIVNFKEEKYYIGSLVVNYNKYNQCFEVIDGQQRLTTIYLLLNYINARYNKNLSINNSLEFEARENAIYTLKKGNIERIINCIICEKDLEYDLKNKINEDIVYGIKNMHNVIEQIVQDNQELLLENIKRVILFRIIVPEETDLNRYFEIMNTRGEQLLQTDIVKAKFLSKLNDSKERTLFSMIWDACSDMSGYIQMHFKNNKVREKIFGKQWDKNINCNFDKLLGLLDLVEGLFKDNEKEGLKFDEIIEPSFNMEYTEMNETEDNDKNKRFKSTINFDYFLLHILHLFKEEEVEYDDKKIIDNFKDFYSADNAKKFIIKLLSKRFIWDKYVLKREYIDEDSDGKWSIKELKVSKSDGENKKAYYVYTGNQDTESQDNNNKELEMIESALRVTYTSNKSMEWLDIIFENNFSEDTDISKIIEKLENYAKEKVKGYLIDERYDLGTKTPHIVFNYLDYILWKRDKENYKEFLFEFRNSVEHWYPQNPSVGSFNRYDDKDRFGNLCLVTTKINSKFSNAAPNGKIAYISEIMDKQSIKLQIMKDKTMNQEDVDRWRESNCEKHEKEMIDILKKAVGLL